MRGVRVTRTLSDAVAFEVSNTEENDLSKLMTYKLIKRWP